ncbi:MAG: hypothetical protein A3C81_00140 [Candidatus Yanofskybacteria bacterium RIFCSPHIGHO2_02_FULL_46_19]|uniref:Type 4 fimbrial biogenesis protein PilX N-terminal domain-containing protein n=1 Tax=Candidatus Yanofskybacteria bacterium RIFCSPHIGHO2_02_FULL_46_19 TaxID=1802684 RepID=A0A1F8FS12_9BACT|nr:MAG: hypothetical protein A3C81_00140 [Candidatus Yanofskybacteria bacterium RIFCSPHIGHO2_02_FULL_46_19]
MTLKENSGFIALTAVIVMMGVVLIFAVSANRSALGELLNTTTEYRSQQSFYRSDACLEEALFRLREDASYNGGTMTFADGSCEITVVPSGALRTITINASYRNEYRSVYAEAVVGAHNITLQTWRENF